MIGAKVVTPGIGCYNLLNEYIPLFQSQAITLHISSCSQFWQIPA